MTTRKPLAEGNTRNIQKGNVVQSSSQPNVRPTAPPPSPQQNTNNGSSTSGGSD